MVFVAQHIADPGQRRPAHVLVLALQIGREMAARLRDDLDASLHAVSKQPVPLKIAKRLAGDRRLNPHNSADNLIQDGAELARHQNTRTADRSMSARNIGCRLSRVVTSTCAPNSAFSSNLISMRSKALNLPFGS